MHDTYETPFARYETPFDGDEEARRIDAALDRIDARLIEMEARLDRLTRRQYWWGLWSTLEVLVGLGLMAWWQAL
jgi:hypothetical protein